jgi:hypothetical protein
VAPCGKLETKYLKSHHDLCGNEYGVEKKLETYGRADDLTCVAAAYSTTLGYFTPSSFPASFRMGVDGEWQVERGHGDFGRC